MKASRSQSQWTPMMTMQWRTYGFEPTHQVRFELEPYGSREEIRHVALHDCFMMARRPNLLRLNQIQNNFE